MPIPVTVKPVYDSVGGNLTNYIYWDTSSLSEEDTVSLYRAIGTSATFSNFELIASELSFKINRYADKGVFVGKTYYYLLFPSTEELPIPSDPPSTPILSEVPEPYEQIYDPIKPINFSVQQNNSRQIVFNWEFEEENKNQIVIEYSINNNYEFFTLVSQIPAWKTSVTLDDPNSTDVYYYRAYTINKSKVKSEYSDIVSLLSYAFSKAPPAVPTNLQVVGVSQTSLTLTWTNNNPLEAGLEHLIYISTPGAQLTLLQSVLYDGLSPQTASSITITGLNRSTIYCFVCQARNLGGTSNYSQSVEGYTLEQETPPNTPTGLSGVNIFDISPNIGLIKAQRIYWNNPLINNATERYLQYDTVNTFSTASSISLFPTENTTILTDLLNNTTYYYRLSSVNSLGSVLSTSAQIYMPNPPALPTSLGATSVGETSIRLSWTDNSNDEALFLLQLSGGDYASYTELVAIPSATTSYFLDNTLPQINLEPNTKYNFLLYSIGFGGFSGTPSTWTSATATTQGATLTVPASPTDLRASGQTDIGTFVIQFDDKSTNEDYFELTVKSKDSRDIRNIPGIAGSGTTVTYEVTDLVPDVEYILNLRAKNQTGFSNYANVSGETGIDLSISTTPFAFLNNNLSINVSATSGSYIGTLTDATYSNNSYNYPLVRLEWNNPFAYGDGFVIYEVLSNYTQEVSWLPPDISSIDILRTETTGNFSATYLVKKYLNTYGEKVYSSGVEDTVLIGELNNGPEFISQGNELEPDLNSIRLDTSSISLRWKPFVRADVFSLKKITLETGETDVLLNTDASNITLNFYLDTSAKSDYTNIYYLTLKNNTFGEVVTRTNEAPRGTGVKRTEDANGDPPVIFNPNTGNPTRTPGYFEVQAATSITINQVGPSSVTVSWTPNPLLGSYYLYTRSYEVNILNSNQEVLSSFIYDANINSITYNNLSSDFTYYFSVIGINVVDGSRSRAVVGTFLLRSAYSGELEPLTPPFETLYGVQIVSILPEGDPEFAYGFTFRRFKITWQRHPILASYNIQPDFYAIGITAEDYNPPVNVQSFTTGSVTSYTTNFLNPGNYRVVMVATSGLPPEPPLISLPIITRFNYANPLPLPVTNFRATRVTRTQVTLTWERPEIVQSYIIRKTLVYNNTTQTINIPVNGGTTTSYVDSNVIAGAVVTYEIATLIPGQESEYSAPLTVNIPTTAGPTNPPTIVDAPRACISNTNTAGNVYYRVRRT